MEKEHLPAVAETVAPLLPLAEEEPLPVPVMDSSPNDYLPPESGSASIVGEAPPAVTDETQELPPVVEPEAPPAAQVPERDVQQLMLSAGKVLRAQ